MATLRELIDGSRAVYDSILASHNETVFPQRREVKTRREEVRREVASREVTVNEGRRQAQRVVEYIHAGAEELQAEYQRGYRDGYEVGVNTPRQVQKRNTPSVPILQSSREITLED